MKVFGLLKDFTLVRDEVSQTVVCYGKQNVDKKNAVWHEVVLPKSKYPIVGIAEIKKAVLADINSQTDEKILNGYQWTILHGDLDKPEGERRVGETVSVWLNRENQDNFKEAHRLACLDATKVIPVKFKINEDENLNAIYDTFESFEELNAFYLGAFAYIKNTCLDGGWTEKDSIDWAPYEALFPATEDNGQQQEPAEE